MGNHGRDKNKKVDTYDYDGEEMPLYSEDTYITEYESKEENKYLRTIRSKKGSITEYGVTAEVDVYDILDTFGVTCPALQHLAKKALNAGIRGHKNMEQDLDDIIKSAIRAKELYEIKKRQA